MAAHDHYNPATAASREYPPSLRATQRGRGEQSHRQDKVGVCE